jgi:hypothetical protein
MVINAGELSKPTTYVDQFKKLEFQRNAAEIKQIRIKREIITINIATQNQSAVCGAKRGTQGKRSYERLHNSGNYAKTLLVFTTQS